MSRARIILTLVLVAAAAMLVGLAASTLIERRLAPRPNSRPEATEPQRSHTPSHVIVDV
jgi:hypothetical protein